MFSKSPTKIAPPKPQKVGVGFEIRTVKDVDCVGQCFFCDFSIFLKWYDQSFKGKKPIDGPLLIPIQQAKVPAHYIVNVVDCPLKDEAAYIAPGDPPGIITYEAMYTGILSEMMELEFFPLDSQDLSISIRFKETHVTCQTLSPKDKFQRVRDSVGMAEWLVYNPITTVEVGKAGRSCWSVRLRIYRQADYYIWNVLLPLTLFSGGSFCAFLYEPDDWYSRSCHILQILLAFLALKYVISQGLPRVSFFTLLDLFLYPTFLFISGMIAYNAIIKYCFNIGYLESGTPLARSFDLGFMMCSFIVWFIGHGVYFTRWNSIDAIQRSKMGELLDLPTQTSKINILNEFLTAQPSPPEPQPPQNQHSFKQLNQAEEAEDNLISVDKIKGLDSVGVGFEVRSVKDVDCIAQTFFADFSLTLKFFNQSAWSRIKGNAKGHFTREDTGVPEHYVANAVSLALRDEEFTVAAADPSGVVTYTAMYTGILFEFMELEFFPLDIQDLSISVRFKDTKVRCKTLGPPDKYQRMRESIALTEWCMYEPEHTVEVGKQGKALWSLKMKIFRQWGFFFWNVLLPVNLFSLIGFLAFLYPADDWYSRSCHNLLIVLAVVTFKFIVADSMPKVPFFVLLDLYMFPAFLFLLCMLSYFALIKVPFLLGIWEHGDLGARSIDLLACLAQFVLWASGQVFYAYRFRKVVAAQRSTLGEMLELPSQTENVNIASVVFMGNSSEDVEKAEEEEEPPPVLLITDLKQGSPVGIGYEIRQVKDIDCISQVFWTDFTLIMKFYDEKQKSKQAPAGENLPLKMSDVTMPQHYITNAVELSLKDEQFFLSKDDPPGVVTYEAMYLGVLSEFMELEYFPLDSQDLSISVRFKDTAVRCQTLGPANKWQRIRDSIEMSEWEMYDPNTTVEVGKQGRSTWSLQMKIYRKSGYYVWQVMFPMALFCFMAFFSYAYEADMWYEKSTHTINVLLCFVTFKFVIAESMPKVPFFVLLDMYLLPNFCFLILLVMEYGVMKLYFLTGIFEQDSGLARTLDLLIAAFLFCIWSIFNAFFASSFGRVDAQQRSALGKLLDIPTQQAGAPNVLIAGIRRMMYGPAKEEDEEEAPALDPPSVSPEPTYVDPLSPVSPVSPDGKRKVSKQLLKQTTSGEIIPRPSVAADQPLDLFKKGTKKGTDPASAEDSKGITLLTPGNSDSRTVMPSPRNPESRQLLLSPRDK